MSPLQQFGQLLFDTFGTLLSAFFTNLIGVLINSFLTPLLDALLASFGISNV